MNILPFYKRFLCFRLKNIIRICQNDRVTACVSRKDRSKERNVPPTFTKILHPGKLAQGRLASRSMLMTSQPTRSISAKLQAPSQREGMEAATVTEGQG